MRQTILGRKLGMSQIFDRQGNAIPVTIVQAGPCTVLQVKNAREDIVCFDQYVGPGYSLPTDSMVEAVKLFAKTEAILLDPVYSGKAAAGLIDLVRKNHFPKGANVLFLHTGGSPALYAYMDTFRQG